MEDLGTRLEEAISSGRLPPGARIESERQLAARYRVSRPAVREALRRLEERGLITTYAGRGSFVQEFRPWVESDRAELRAQRMQITARQLSHARGLIECEAAALAAEHATDGELAELTDLLTRLDAASDVEQMVELDMAFHEGLVLASRNVAIQVMFGSVRSMTKALMFRSLTDRAVRQLGLPLHQSVLQAVVVRDAGAASNSMRAHLGIAEQLYGDDLDRPLAAVLRQRGIKAVGEHEQTALTSVSRPRVAAGPATLKIGI